MQFVQIYQLILNTKCMILYTNLLKLIKSAQIWNSLPSDLKASNCFSLRFKSKLTFISISLNYLHIYSPQARGLAMPACNSI
jgi:hypothetical protein